MLYVCLLDTSPVISQTAEQRSVNYGSRLDYSDFIMYGMSAYNMRKLQSAQNSFTHVVVTSLRHLSALQVCELVIFTGFLSTT